MRSTTLGLIVLVLAAAACRDHSTETGPLAPPAPEVARPSISDGAHGGNKHVYLLPPLVKQPSTSGVFNPTLYPVVRIEQSLTAGSWSLVRDFTRSAGQIQIPSGAEHYQVDWDTSQDDINYLAVYRISIFGRETPTGPQLLLAWADVQFAATGKEAKNVTTSDVIGLVDGRVMPVKFRFEEGALVEALRASGHCPGEPGREECGEVVVRSGVVTEFVLNSGHAAVRFGADAIHPDVGAVTGIVARHTPSVNGPCFPTAVTDLEQAEGCYEFNTEPFLPYGFGRNMVNSGTDALVRVEVCLDRSKSIDQYRLYKYSPRRTPQFRELESVKSVLIRCEGFTTSSTLAAARGPGWLRALAGAGASLLGPLASLLGHTPLYATDAGEGGLTGSFSPSHIGYGRPLAISVQGGDGQSATVGSTLPVSPSVRVTAGRSGEGHPPVPVQGVPVTWIVTEGGGSSSAAVSHTNADGVASVQWTLGGTAGTNALRASVAGGGAVTLTAQGTEQDVITFEHFPDGSPACGSCALTNHFSSRGVTFSFTSQYTELTNAQLFQSTAYDPADEPANHSVTSAAAPDGGFFSGTVHMALSSSPTWASFRIRGNNSIALFPVSYRDGTGASSSTVSRSGVVTYTPGGAAGPFREEIVTVEDADGIQQINVGMNGFIVLIDNLRVTVQPRLALAGPGRWGSPTGGRTGFDAFRPLRGAWLAPEG